MSFWTSRAFVAIVFLILGTVQVILIAEWDASDGEIVMTTGRLVRVDAEQEKTIRWLDEELCCSSNEPDASCPKDALPCSVINAWCDKRDSIKQNEIKECVPVKYKTITEAYGESVTLFSHEVEAFAHVMSVEFDVNGVSCGAQYRLASTGMAFLDVGCIDFSNNKIVIKEHSSRCVSPPCGVD